MKIILATNCLKGSLSAVQAAEAIKCGFLSVSDNFDITQVPIADGGDGTLDAIKYYREHRVMKSIVTGPLGDKVEAEWLIVHDKAIIEAARANGLSLLTPERYNPLKTTTYGVGELIMRAAESGCEEIILAIGGSSTNDAGIGMLEALDYKFPDVKIKAACDVDNPLLGPNGASYVYGPQKGASKEDVEFLEAKLKAFADLTEKRLGVDYKYVKGAGAAGGLGFALKAYAGAELVTGFSLVAELAGLEEKIQDADLVITTEGRFDAQSLQGKAPYRVVQMAEKYEVPVIIISGTAEEGMEFSSPVFTLAGEAGSIKDAIENAYYLMESLSKKIARLIIDNHGDQVKSIIFRKRD